MRKLIGLIFGAAIGALLGATLALLFAPVAGEELRGQIRSRGVAFSTDVRSAAQNRRAELEQRLAELRAPRKPVPPPPPAGPVA